MGDSFEYLQAETSSELETHVRHSSQIGDELARLDEGVQLLHQHAHHFAWLLQGGFCGYQAQQDKVAMREQLQNLAQIVETLECWSHDLSDGETIAIQICEVLNEELSQWRDLFYKLPAATHLHSQHRTLGGDIQKLQVEGETLGQKINFLGNCSSKAGETDMLCQRLCSLRRRIEALATRPLEEELEALLFEYWETRQRGGNDQNGRQEHQARIIRRRFGWDGMPPGTLQAASEVGLWEITRERARQTVLPFEQWLQNAKPFAPATQRAIHFIENQLPGLADDIELGLCDGGLTREVFRIEALIEAAQSLGIKTHFSIAHLPCESDNRLRLVWADENNSSSDHLTLAMKALQDHVWERGIGHLPSLRNELEEKSEDAAELLDPIMDTLHGLRWLKQSEGWFWLSSNPVMRRQKNRLLTQVERTLCVAGSLEISRLHTAIERYHHRLQDRPQRLEWEMPPLPVLEEWCHQVPFCRVEDDLVRMENPLSPEEVLSGVELTMVQLIRQHGPLLSRWKLQQLCAEQGIAKPTFYIYVDGLSTIEEFDEGVFGLTGTAVTEEMLDEFHADFSNFPQRRLTRYGRLNDGRLWISYQLAEGVINNGSLNLPRALRGRFSGRYPMTTFEGVSVGNLAFNAIQLWGLRAFFREQAKVNDRLTIIIDEGSRQALVTLTNKQLSAEIINNL